MTASADTPPNEERQLAVRNVHTGPVSGNLVQTGAITGDVHVHSPAPTPVPRQLPPVSTYFASRTEEMAAITEAVDRAGEQQAIVTALAGIGGVGKTTLALRWAHHHLDRFPDGQLFVDLHGFAPTGEPTPPAMVVRGFLDALGVEATRMPVGTDAQFGLYRSLVAGRRMLIILDNAADADQVTPLLPGSASCVVLVTSRHRLPGLVAAHGARVLSVGCLSAAQSRQLLSARLGSRRVDDEPGAVHTLAECCGGIPLALSIVAARAADHPRFPLGDLAAEVRDEATRLSALDDGDRAANLPAVISWSYRRLSAEQLRAFVFLCCAPGVDVSFRAAAELTDLPDGQLRTILRALERLSLLEQPVPGRWQIHDLLRLHAAENAVHAVGPGVSNDLAAATWRLLGYYLSSSAAASESLNSAKSAPSGTRSAARASAVAWFDAEYPNLVASVKMTSLFGAEDYVINLTNRLYHYFDLRKMVPEWLTTHRLALACARRIADRNSEGILLNSLGRIYQYLHQWKTAANYTEQSSSICRELGDKRGLATTLSNLGLVHQNMDRHHDAARCHREALAVFRAIGDRRGEASTLNNLALSQQDLNEWGDASSLHRQAADLARKLNLPHLEGTALDNLGLTDQHFQRPLKAIRRHRRALDIFEKLGDLHLQATALNNIGSAYQTLNRWQEAAEYHQRDLAICKKLEDSASELAALEHLITISNHVKNHNLVINYSVEAIHICRRLDTKPREGRALNALGEALQTLERWHEADNIHTTALAIFRSLGDRHGEALTLAYLSRVRRGTHRYDEELLLLEQARAIMKTLPTEQQATE
ncbi:ATP-binding protein [Amycolatopsis sp. CB00013]|uniref:ATP-binding protein n=1 Tax=Amycolatopsis sp. CB00013 TaxID=1703945 RepID=UPI0009F927F5|nr:tetratricopeptide repeat protein [Amycolatopsis sp. CB00013]